MDTGSEERQCLAKLSVFELKDQNTLAKNIIVKVCLSSIWESHHHNKWYCPSPGQVRVIYKGFLLGSLMHTLPVDFFAAGIDDPSSMATYPNNSLKS